MKVICEHFKVCHRRTECGGAKVHDFDAHECGHCPIDKDARCTTFFPNIPVKNDWPLVRMEA